MKIEFYSCLDQPKVNCILSHSNECEFYKLPVKVNKAEIGIRFVSSSGPLSTCLQSSGKMLVSQQLCKEVMVGYLLAHFPAILLPICESSNFLQ